MYWSQLRPKVNGKRDFMQRGNLFEAQINFQTESSDLQSALGTPSCSQRKQWWCRYHDTNIFLKQRAFCLLCMSSFDQTKRENQRFTGVIIPFNCLMSRLVNFLTKNWTDLGTWLHGTLGILSPANIWIGHSKNENRTELEKIKSGGKTDIITRKKTSKEEMWIWCFFLLFLFIYRELFVFKLWDFWSRLGESVRPVSFWN